MKKFQSHLTRFHEEREQFADALEERLGEKIKQIDALKTEGDAALGIAVDAVDKSSSLQSKLDSQPDDLDELRGVREEPEGHEVAAFESLKKRTRTVAEAVPHSENRERVSAIQPYCRQRPRVSPVARAHGLRVIKVADETQPDILVFMAEIASTLGPSG